MIKLVDLLGLALLVLAAALSVASVAVAVGLWLALLVAALWLMVAGVGCMVTAYTQAQRTAASKAVTRVAA
jgi:hypothetical protein